MPSEETLEYCSQLLQRPFTAPWEASGVLLSILEQLRTRPGALYRTQYIEKGNGKMRRIDEPNKILKFVQKQISLVLNHAWVAPGVCGFVLNNSAQQGLRGMIDTMYVGTEEHPARGPIKAVYQEDIENQFGSITRDQVEEALREHFFTRILHDWEKGPKLPNLQVGRIAEVIAEVCCYEGHLPQGSPASPVLSNIVCTRFDFALRRLLGKQGVYGRYADDMVVLACDKLDTKFRGKFRNILNTCGFNVNREKGEYEEHRRRKTEEESSGDPRQRFRIWGMDLVVDDDAQTAWFRLPRNMERQWVEDISAMLEGAGDLPRDSKEFMSDTRVLEVLGRLAYAFQVTRWGHPDHIKGREFPGRSDERPEITGAHEFLPKDLARIWRAFRAEFGGRLPQRHRRWFHDTAPLYSANSTRVPVTSGEFEERLHEFGVERGFDEATLIAELNHYQQHFQSDYPLVDADGVQYRAAGQSNDYPDEALAEASELFVQQSPSVSDTERLELLRRTLACFSGFVRCLFAGQLQGFSISEQHDSLLPVNGQRPWQRLLQECRRAGISTPELVRLFDASTSRTQYRIRPKTLPKKVHREHLHLYGFDND